MQQEPDSRIAVVSGIIGRDEGLPTVCSPDPRIRYLLYTDGVIDSAPSPWQLRRIPAVFADPARDSKRLRLLPHLFLPDVDVFVWADATVDIIDLSVETVLELIDDADIALLRHPSRSCAFEEAEIVARKGLDAHGRVARQIAAYRAAGLPDAWGLFATTFSIRRINERSCRRFNHFWWEQVILHSRRDQISLPYALWMLNPSFKTLPLHLNRNRVFKWNPTRGPASGVKRKRTTPEILGSALRESSNPEHRHVEYHSLFDTWSGEFISQLHAFNGAVAQDVEALAGCLLYVDGERHCQFSPPDPRLGPEREVFLRSLADRTHVLQLGFGTGHDALLALSQSDANVTAVTFNGEICSGNAAKFLEEAFCDRFRLLRLENRTVRCLDLGLYDAVHLSRSLSQESQNQLHEEASGLLNRGNVIIVEPLAPTARDGSRSLPGMAENLRPMGELQTAGAGAFTVASPASRPTQFRIVKSVSNYASMLKRLHQSLNPETYLEIGVFKGRTLSLAQGRAIGIDPAPRVDDEFLSIHPLTTLYRMKSDDFFSSHTVEEILGAQRVDFAFIDGYHELGQVLRDFANVESWSSPSGMIAIHDVIPPSVLAASRAWVRDAWCGDVWQIVNCLRQVRPDLDCLLVDTPPSGVLLVRNLDPSNDILIRYLDDILQLAPKDGHQYETAVKKYIMEIAESPKEEAFDPVGWCGQAKDFQVASTQESVRVYESAAIGIGSERMDNDVAEPQLSDSKGEHISESLLEHSSSPETQLQAGTLPTADFERGTRLYLNLLRNCLTRVLFDRDFSVAASTGKRYPRNLEKRAEGRDWPAEAETMVGVKRLENIELCIADVLRRNVPGDLVETGIWRGGAAIFMRAALEAFGDTSRVVWAADSFLGPPAPDPLMYPHDRASKLHRLDFLAVPQDEVKRNFARYGLLDERVRFISGWFRESLPVAPIDKLALLHMDGDLYESTMVALQSLYGKLSVGGYVIIDDYYSSRGCRQAVDEFRAEQRILEPLIGVDWTSVYWQRTG